MSADSDEDECPGAGLCHGPLGWCSTCGDVDQVCDMRLRGERCDKHPVPPGRLVLRSARSGAEAMIAEGKRMQREGEKALAEVVDGERARRAFDEQEEASFWTAMKPAS